MFVIDLSTSVHFYFIHRVALLILRERQKEKLYAHMQKHSVYVYKIWALCRFYSCRLLSP